MAHRVCITKDKMRKAQNQEAPQKCETRTKQSKILTMIVHSVHHLAVWFGSGKLCSIYLPHAPSQIKPKWQLLRRLHHTRVVTALITTVLIQKIKTFKLCTVWNIGCDYTQFLPGMSENAKFSSKLTSQKQFCAIRFCEGTAVISSTWMRAITGWSSAAVNSTGVEILSTLLNKEQILIAHSGPLLGCATVTTRCSARAVRVRTSQLPSSPIGSSKIDPSRLPLPLRRLRSWHRPAQAGTTQSDGVAYCGVYTWFLCLLYARNSFGDLLHFHHVPLLDAVNQFLSPFLLPWLQNWLPEGVKTRLLHPIIR